MMPGLPRFLETYPEIRLQLSEGDRFVDLVREGVDCMLRVGELTNSSLIARRIGTLEEGTFASPVYLEQHGVPRSTDDLDKSPGRLPLGPRRGDHGIKRSAGEAFLADATGQRWHGMIQ
jgi:DNA-binding transcriptional LysR family regulator